MMFSAVNVERMTVSYSEFMQLQISDAIELININIEYSKELEKIYANK